MRTDTLLFVPQVSPYVTGPAGVHGVLGQAEVAVAQLAELNGLRAEVARDVRSVSTADLSCVRALVLFTIGETPWKKKQRAAILQRLRAGELAVMALHSATDACYGWEDYGQLVGARFNGQPWTQDFTMDVVDKHPATRHLGDQWHWRDEIYQFRDLRPDAQVLLRVPAHQLDLHRPGVDQPEFGFPLSWCFTEGDGRVFSTSLGHFPAAWEHPVFLQHLNGGLVWTLGDD